MFYIIVKVNSIRNNLFILLLLKSIIINNISISISLFFITKLILDVYDTNIRSNVYIDIEK